MFIEVFKNIIFIMKIVLCSSGVVKFCVRVYCFLLVVILIFILFNVEVLVIMFFVDMILVFFYDFCVKWFVLVMRSFFCLN